MLLVYNLHVWVPLKAVQLTLSPPSLYALPICSVQGAQNMQAVRVFVLDPI